MVTPLNGTHSENDAFLLLLLLGRTEDGADSLIEDLLQAHLGQGRALQVAHRLNLLGHLQPLGMGDGRQTALSQLVHRTRVVPQIQLRA